MKVLLPYGVVVCKVNCKVVSTSLPGRLFGTGNVALPLEHVERVVGVGEGLGDKTEGMVGSPLLPFPFETVDDQLVGFLVVVHCGK